jgi:hypothetical protein
MDPTMEEQSRGRMEKSLLGDLLVSSFVFMYTTIRVHHLLLNDLSQQKMENTSMFNCKTKIWKIYFLVKMQMK